MLAGAPPAREVRDCRHRDLWRKRQRSNRGPRSDRTVVGSVWHGPPSVVEEPSLDTIELAGELTRAIARRNPPAELAVMRKSAGIADAVLLLDERGAPAVLEVIDAVLAHELILDATKIDPHMGELMREERSGIQIL